MDFYALVQLVCPDVPLALIEGCISLCIGHDTNQQQANKASAASAYASSKYYRIGNMAASLYFYFMFTEWLMMLEVLYFSEGGTRNNVVKKSLTTLESNFHEWRRTAPKNIMQPSVETLSEVVKYLRGISFESTFEEFMQCLLKAIKFPSYLTDRYKVAQFS